MANESKIFNIVKVGTNNGTKSVNQAYHSNQNKQIFQDSQVK